MASRFYNATLRNMQYRLRKFKDMLPEHLSRLLLKNEELILDIVRYDQLYAEGIEGKGISIQSYAPYAVSTVHRKIKKNQPYDRVTLNDTGEFYDKFKLVVESDGFYITSDDDKTEALTDKYGNTIFRLTNQNFTSLMRDSIKPELINIFKDSLKHD